MGMIQVSETLTVYELQLEGHDRGPRYVHFAAHSDAHISVMAFPEASRLCLPFACNADETATNG
jgi:hypothetical protein